MQPFPFSITTKETQVGFQELSVYCAATDFDKMFFTKQSLNNSI